MNKKYKSKHLLAFRTNVQRGKEGKNMGIPIRCPKLSRHIHGLQRRRIILLGGETGTGKTAFADDHLVVEPHDWLLNNPMSPLKLETEYWTLEITPEEKIAKWVCAKLFKTFGDDINLITYNDGVEDRVIDSDYVLGRATDIYDKLIEIQPEHEAMIDDAMEYMDALLENIIFISTNPIASHISKRLKAQAERYGVFEEYGGEIIYHDQFPDIIRQDVYDHIGLFKKGKDGKKSTIDDASAEWIFYRDICGHNIVPISQFNRNIQDVQRAKMGAEPQLGDFKDTSNTQEDADHVIALFHPYRHKLLDYKEYNVGKMKDRIRTLHLLKNRHGAADKIFGLHFIGEVGMTTELPKPGELDMFSYDKLINLR